MHTVIDITVIFRAMRDPDHAELESLDIQQYVLKYITINSDCMFIKKMYLINN